MTFTAAGHTRLRRATLYTLPYPAYQRVPLLGFGVVTDAVCQYARPIMTMMFRLGGITYRPRYLSRRLHASIHSHASMLPCAIHH